MFSWEQESNCLYFSYSYSISSLSFSPPPHTHTHTNTYSQWIFKGVKSCSYVIATYSYKTKHDKITFLFVWSISWRLSLKESFHTRVFLSKETTLLSLSIEERYCVLDLRAENSGKRVSRGGCSFHTWSMCKILWGILGICANTHDHILKLLICLNNFLSIHVYKTLKIPIWKM